MAEEEKEEIYETTVQVLHLGYGLEDAKERLGNMVVINDTMEETVVSDWSHLKDPEYRQRTITRLTREIKRRERRR